MAYQTDTADGNSKASEFTTLYVGESQSVFCTSKYLLIDSAMESEFSKGNSRGAPMSFIQANPTRSFFVIFKLNDVITTYDEAAPFLPNTSFYKYNEPRNTFQWNILPDTISIGGIECQKAETFFGNRHWVAWFATSVPVSEGPYKFCGLPGLILNINDTQGYWNFKLASIEKADTTFTLHFSNKIAESIKSKELFFERKKYIQDNRFELMKMAGTRFGNEVDARQRLKERAAKDNNWLELIKSP